MSDKVAAAEEAVEKATANLKAAKGEEKTKATVALKEAHENLEKAKKDEAPKDTPKPQAPKSKTAYVALSGICVNGRIVGAGEEFDVSELPEGADIKKLVAAKKVKKA